jgi:hypothetical protein
MKNQVILGLLASLLLAPVLLQAAIAEDTTGSVSVSATCGLTLDDTSLDFGTLARNAVSSLEPQLNLNNTGSAVGYLTVSGKNWLDGSAVSHIYGNYTKFATSDVGSGTYASKTALNSTDGAVNFGSINPGPAGSVYPNATYWQVQGVLHNLPFFGTVTQVITITASC